MSRSFTTCNDPKCKGQVLNFMIEFYDEKLQGEDLSRLDSKSYINKNYKISEMGVHQCTAGSMVYHDEIIWRALRHTCIQTKK